MSTTYAPEALRTKEEDLRKRSVVRSIRRESRLADRDVTARWLTLAASGLSVAAFAYFFAMGVTTIYVDSISHLEIARRVFDSPTIGLAQLGGVWLPLPHLLALPLVWFNPFYFNGVAGSIVSMASFVAASVLVYKTAYRLTDNKVAGIIAAAVFMLNPNILYMQSTPMTELPLFACMAGMVYGVQRWIQTDGVKPLVWGAVAAVLGSLTRYEAWPMSAILVAVVALVMWRRKYAWKKIANITLAFFQFALLGVGLWMVWNLLIFKNPLYFQDGEFAKPSLWVSTGEKPVGNLPFAALTYSDAVVDNLMIGVIVLAAVGLVVMLMRERLASKTLPVLSLLAIFPFFVVTLYLGQRPLHIEELVGDYYNVRFGLLMVIPAAVLVGYLVSVFASRKRAFAAVSVAAMAVVLATAAPTIVQPSRNIVTLKEPVVGLARGYSSALQVAAFLKTHYTGGTVLSESFGNELVLYKAGITPGHNLYEGSYQVWQPALKNPAAYHVQWVVMRQTVSLDKVYLALHGTPALLDNYKQVYATSGYFVYERKS